MHPCKIKNLIQLESVPFQSSTSAYLVPKISCEVSHIQVSERDIFKKKLPNERRNNLDSFCKSRVVPNIELNNKYKKCVMHPCNKNSTQLEPVSFQSSVSAYLTPNDNIDEELIRSGLGKISQPPIFHHKNNNNHSSKYHNVQQKVILYLKSVDLDHVVIKNLIGERNGDYFLDYNRKILFFLSPKLVSKWLLTKYSDYSIQVVQKRDFKMFVAKPKMVTQGLVDAVSSMFYNIRNTSQGIIKIVKNLNNPQIAAWFIDVMNLTLELSDPFFWRPVSLLKFIARFYSAMIRFSDFKDKNKNILFPQSLEEISSIDSIMLMLTCFGLPEPIMRSLKQISLVTSKKLLDSPNIVMDLIQKFLEVCHDILVWLKDTLKLDFISSIIEIILQPLNFVKGLKLTSKMTKITIDFQKNNQIIFDPVIRCKCVDLYEEMTVNHYIQSLLANPAYKLYVQQYNTLQVMVKLSKNFEVSARNEPVCIVFEGKAGSGKSTIMNKVVDYLVKKNFSIYNHTCPAVDAAKDFYDDYLDQDVFVMDDVGQQGVSQWRQIINFVSPVKFPLDCAEAKNKNTKYFNSKLLLLTTNHFSDLHNFTKADCIAEPSALFRRCHVLNFNNTSFSNGRMSGKIQYKKFDHTTDKWNTQFIGPQADCILKPFCNIVNNNNTVAWIFSLITIFLEKQKNMFTNNALSVEDEEQIDDLVYNFISDKTEEEEYFPASDELDTQSYTHLMSYLTKDNLGVFKEYLSNMTSSLYEKTTDIYDFLKNEPRIYIGLLMGCFQGAISALTVIAGYKLYELIVGDVAPNDLTVNTYRQQSVKLWNEAHEDYVQRTIPSMIIDNGNDTLTDIVKNDAGLSTRISSLRSKMRIIELVSKDGFKNISQGIISGRRAMVQTHSYNTTEGVANIFRDWNCFGNNSYECNNIPFKVIKEWPEYDMAIIEISLGIPIYKDATHSLFNSSLDDDIPYNAKQMFFVNPQAALSLDNNFVVNKDSFQVQNPTLNKAYTVQPGTGIVYGITASGLCGSLLVDANHGLCGVHVAGNVSTGFAFVLPKRVLRELKQMLVFKESQHLDIKEHEEKDYSGLKLFNNIFPSKRPLQKSNLHKSELFDCLIEEVKEHGEKQPPNFLSCGSKTLPEIAKKSLKPIPYISSDSIEFGKKCIKRFFIPFDDLSDKEVIKGVKEDNLSGLNKLSVNGYGYEKEKELYMDFEKGEITPLFANKIKKFKQNCNSDQTQIEELLFYEAFKDELRLVEKKDKPRSFRVAPLHHTFLVKKYLGKLFAHCKKNMWENQMAIGMNPYRDWNKLYKRAKSAYINFDGDFGNWDGGAPAQVQDAISELVMEFYRGKDPIVLKTLLDSMVRTFVLIKEKVVLTTHSMPSGCWVTAFFNSLINRFLSAMVLYEEMRKDDKVPTVDDFDELFDFVLGDDKFCGSPQRLCKYFNAITMRNFATKIGMKYTDGEKGEITEPSKLLTDCVFLKRSFKFHKELGKTVGPLSLNTLANSLRYTDSSRNYDDIMGGKMTAFQFEIFLHENEILKNKILTEAEGKSFYFKTFSNEHIKKSMEEETTYAYVMKCLGKNVSNFL